MCCDNWNSKADNSDEVMSECPKCGGEAVYNTRWGGYASTDHCNYSPECCEECGFAPCDGSC